MTDEPPQIDGAIVRIAAREPSGAIMQAARRLDRAGVGVEDLVVRRPTLDDAFLALTGHRAEATDGDDETTLEEVAA